MSLAVRYAVKGRPLRSLGEEAVTYGGQYIHVADLKSLVYGLVEHYTVVQGSEHDASASTNSGV